jgi:hypothetical protein
MGISILRIAASRSRSIEAAIVAGRRTEPGMLSPGSQRSMNTDKNQDKKRPADKSGLSPIPCRSWRRQVHYAALPQNLPIPISDTGHAGRE